MTALAGLVLLGMALLGAPLFAVIAAAALWGFASEGVSAAAVVIELYRLTDAPALLAIPFFTFAGFLMAEARTPQRLTGLARAALGWMPGGLAVVTLTTCAFFTAFTGASGATIVALGGLLYASLLQDGYPGRFSLGLVTSSGGLGLLFPPSLPLILYGVVAGVNIDHLFLAGIAPGLLLVAILAVYSVRTGGRAAPRTPFSGAALGRALREAAWELPLPVLILGGIYGGFYTAAEAAAVAAFYVFIVEVFVYRDLDLRRDVPRIARESMVLVGVILVILGASLGLTNYLVDQQVPQKLLGAMKALILNRWVFLLMLNLFLLAVGCLMDIFSAIVVVTPLILPIAREFGVHPVHLAIIFLANLEIGYTTPPVGLNLFISANRFRVPLSEVWRASMPFLWWRFLALALITYIPPISLAPLRWLLRAGF
jgi:tripartite ATP-independent transporter DctM subunit